MYGPSVYREYCLYPWTAYKRLRELHKIFCINLPQYVHDFIFTSQLVLAVCFSRKAVR